MWKIRMCNVFMFVLDYTIVFVTGETDRLLVTLCEDSGSAEVSCPENKTIGWKSIVYGDFPCQNAENRAICYSNINTFFNEHCPGQNNCTLPMEILSNNSCQRSPRRVQVNFECSRSWWHKNRHPKPVETCANSLDNVHCSSNYHIHFKNAAIYCRNACDDKKSENCAKGRLKNNCNEKRRCISDKTNTSCLYHKRSAIIQYACTGPTDDPVTDSILSTSTESTPRTTTIIASRNVTSENEERYDFSLDNDHRVVIYRHSVNQTYHLCNFGWDDNDSAVFCKYLNQTWKGTSRDVDTLLDIPIAPYSLHCDGLEVSLFQCNYTVNVTSCNTNKVAGAVCCQGTDRRGKCVTNPSSQKVSSEKSGSSTLGIAVGLSVAVLVVICVVVVIALIRQRYVKNDSKQTFSNIRGTNTDDEYIGHQNIALPQYPSPKKEPYSQGTNSSIHTTRNNDGQYYSHPSNDTQSPYALSEDGVYDKTNERRHVVNDTDEYSRTLDTVYDSAEQNTRKDRKEETYDHVFGQKTEDNYDKSSRP
ncbi:uncharacterized protein LOC134724769 isoform X2 [Mytilus trossulus]|uniref:uncharacterized protein LOC134724769 isoform X2 n=1 Tax=Mytilus trossulus TaxID=6551 RepID=UPI0030076BB7